MVTPIAVRTLLLRQNGVISRTQARQCGLGTRRIDYLLATGEWLRVRPGVFRLATAIPTPEAAVRASALWLGDGACLTGWGAGWWWELHDEPPPWWHFVMNRSSHLQRQPGVRLSRSFVDPYDRVRHRDVAVISLPLAVLRTAAHLEQVAPGSGITLVDRAKQRRVVRVDDLELAFRRNSGTWGSRAIRRLLDRTTGRAHSVLERRAVRELRAAGLTGFVVNLRTVLTSGRPVEIDIAFEAQRVAIELDGYAYHSSPEAHRADLQRQNELLADGWTLLRFTWSDLVQDPAAFVAQVRELLAKQQQ